MATTVREQGQFSLAFTLYDLFSGDTTGQRQVSINEVFQLGPTASLPGTVAVGCALAGEITAANGDILLGTTADPFGSMGDSVYNDGLSPIGKNLILLVLVNEDPTNSITIKRGATLGVPFTDTAGAGLPIGPYGEFIWWDPTGVKVTNLQSGVNDKITLAISGGSPKAKFLAVFAP